MHDDNSLRTTAFAIRRSGDGWYIDLSDKALLGPYLSGEAVLAAAAEHALLARDNGLQANVYIHDDEGDSHQCLVLDHVNDPHRCVKCEASWQTGGHVPRCPLRCTIPDS